MREKRGREGGREEGKEGGINTEWQIDGVLIEVEETKLNNHNANDHETAHTGTFS